MDRLRFTTIAHRDHVFCNPLGSSKVDSILALLELSPGERVVDIGCGKAEFLIRLVERFGVSAVGVDTNPHFLREGEERAAERIPGADFSLENVDAAQLEAEPGSFAAALCVGSTHAYGGYRATLRALSKLVRSGGLILVGEGYWKRRPGEEYLAFLDALAGDYLDHAGNVAAGVEEDLIPLYSSVSSEDEWDHYEGLYCRAVERHASAHPDDGDCAEMRRRIRAWRDAYLRWGRQTLGFGQYLFRNNAS